MSIVPMRKAGRVCGTSLKVTLSQVVRIPGLSQHPLIEAASQGIEFPALLVSLGPRPCITCSQKKVLKSPQAEVFW